MSISSDICAIPDVRIREQVPGSSLTTFCIGGPLEFLLEANSVASLAACLKLLASAGQEFRVLGNGSNLLIPTAGLKGFTLTLGKGFRVMTVGGSEVEVGGSYPLMPLSRELCERGLSGFEFAAGIPGQVGGALRMNSGAHGSEIGNLVKEVQYLSPDGEFHVADKRDLEFSYRHSSLPKDAIVTNVTLELKSGNKDEILSRRTEYLARRKKTQPLSSPSAGSIFRNPRADLSAGFAIEKVGLKGVSIGGARISELHANWIINDTKTATDSDVLKLIELCKERVQAEFGVLLLTELVSWV